MSVNSKMTSIADETRSLLGISGKLGLDAMSTNLETANTEVATQEGLMEEILTTLAGKMVGGGSGGSLKKATGTFTLAEGVSHYYIDITDLGWIPDLVFVNLDETDLNYDSNPTKAWVIIDFPEVVEGGRNDYLTSGTDVIKTNLAFTFRGEKGTNVIQNGATTIHNVCINKNGKTCIRIAPASTSYPLTLGTYNWIAYKIWEEE